MAHARGSHTNYPWLSLSHFHAGINQLLRDLGLPTGINPGKMLLQAAARALADDDDAEFERVRQQVISKQRDARALGGECCFWPTRPNGRESSEGTQSVICTGSDDPWQGQSVFCVSDSNTPWAHSA